MQSFRAACLLVDIGLHTGRPIPKGLDGAGTAWTYERAVKVIMRASGFDRGSATMEVSRYLAWPAQAPSYKLGEGTWLEVRAETIARKGAAFNRREWHASHLA